jgi:YjbE family integral membrane protein
MGIELFNAEFLAVLGSVVLINIVLSGDNAVVIALASRNLAHDQQKKAVFWGSFGAILMRVVLTIIAVSLLNIPLIQFIGGILLIWIAIKLLIEEKGDGHCNLDADCLMSAVKTIIFADLVMSIDNVIAVAGATRGNIPLLIFSLIISIPLIMWGSNVIMRLMERYPIIVTLGAGLLGYTAGEMILADVFVAGQLQNGLQFLHSIIPVVTTIGVIVAGWLLKSKQRDKALS